MADDLLSRADDLEYALEQASKPGGSAELDSCRRLYPAEDDVDAIRLELSRQGISTQGVALVIIDDPRIGDREMPVGGRR